MSFQPSKYQQAIFDWVDATNNISTRYEMIGAKQNTNFLSLMVEARAGSGKTSTGIEVFKLLPSQEDVIFVAFNKHIAQELAFRLPNGTQARTYHSLGFQAIRDNMKSRVQVDNDKLDKFLRSGLDRYAYGYAYPSIKRLTSLCKANLLQPDYETLTDLAFFHDIEVNGDSTLIFDWVGKLLEMSANETNIIDFDDMCWLPIVLNMKCHRYDFLFVDEFQDTNRGQMELALRSIAPGGRLIGVGDRYQSIYAFRGADSGAIPNFIRLTEAETLPLSITYRNPQLVVDLVQQKFPEIGLEARENAPAGTFGSLQSTKLLETAEAGDMILCRTNAPMIENVFEFIRNGKKAIIKGRDIGKSLQTFINKFNENDLPALLRKIKGYEVAEIDKFMAREAYEKIQQLQDKVETIFALADGASTVSELNIRIETIFSDEVEGVIFSSIHKAKGLEAKRIFILRPDLLPHPMAKKAGQKQQERNIEYVAYTRTLNDLIILQ